MTTGKAMSRGRRANLVVALGFILATTISYGVAYFRRAARGEWTVRIGCDIEAAALVVGRLCVLTPKGLLIAVDSSTGSTLWKFQVPGGGTDCILLGVSQHALLVSSAQWLCAVDAGSGRLIWCQPVTSSSDASFCETKQTVMVHAVDLSAVDASSGARVWTSSPPASDVVSAGCANESVFFLQSSKHSMLYAVDASNGRTLWRAAEDGIILTSNSGRVILMRDVSNSFKGVSGSDGRLIWVNKSWSSNLSQYVWATASTDGTAVVATWDGIVVRFRTCDGSLIWRTDIPGCVRSEPTISGDYIYIGAGIGHAYALNASDGRVMYESDTSSVFDRLSPTNQLVVGCTNSIVLGPDNSIFVTTTYGSVSRVRVK